MWTQRATETATQCEYWEHWRLDHNINSVIWRRSLVAQWVLTARHTTDYTSQDMISAPFLIFCIFSVQASIDIEPRKLTSDEIKANIKLPIASLLSTVKPNSSGGSPTNFQLKHVAKGANKEKGWKDAVRMPGTNWCGKGWRADNARSMGGYSGADRCCRQHDLGCPLSIEPGQTEYGLTNVRFHTVMHCDCDERFSSCLKMARTQAADIVGNLFFNVAHIPCFVFSKEQVSRQVESGI